MIFATDLSRPEGPVLLPDGSWLVVEMGPERGCVSRVSADGKSRRPLARTGRPNGLAVDREGTIWVAESINPPSLLRLTMDGEHEIVLTGCDGEPFLFPNDLAFGRDGALYMTDSGILYGEWDRQRASYRNLHTDGRLYRIDLETREIARLDSGFRFTNGIAFGADGSLYINESFTGDVFRYPWEDGEVKTGREVFANVLDPEGPDVFKGPDGMAFGQDGRLYVTVFGQGDVTVLDPDGSVAERLPLEGKSPTNVAFGSPGEKRLYVTEQAEGRMEVLEVGIDGLPLYRG